MSDDVSFQIDTSGGAINRSSRLMYSLNGNLEESLADGCSKPSQDRPAIFKIKAKRYHEKGDDSKFIPGKLSKELRVALGLSIRDIPEHIYRMRHLGYPPGWLKRAEVQTENLSITGANAVVNSSTNESVKYDWTKLYPFPGFNTFDRYNPRFDRARERGFMSMQENCLLENFRQFLSEERLLGHEPTDMKGLRGRRVIDTSTDFNLPPMAASTPEKPRAPPRLIDLSDGELDEDDNVQEVSGPAPGSTEEGTCIIVPPVEKPPLARFSEGINDHRLFENLPNVGGAYKRVLSVLKKIPQ